MASPRTRGEGTCPFCGKRKKKLGAHVPHCPSNPDAVSRRQDSPQAPVESPKPDNTQATAKVKAALREALAIIERDETSAEVQVADIPEAVEEAIGPTEPVSRRGLLDRLFKQQNGQAEIPMAWLMVFDKHEFEVEQIPETDVPRDTFMWQFEGKWVHLVERKNGELKPISLRDVLTAKDNIPPSRLYRALRWKEAEIVFRIPDTLMEKLNVGLTVALLGILGFFIYLVFSSIANPGV